MGGLDQQWDCDLGEMGLLSSWNKGLKYIFLAINIFPRFVWALPLPNKQPSTIVNTLKNVFLQGRKPSKIRTDKGGEFNNKMVKSFLQKSKVITPTAQTVERAKAEVKRGDESDVVSLQQQANSPMKSMLQTKESITVKRKRKKHLKGTTKRKKQPQQKRKKIKKKDRFGLY